MLNALLQKEDRGFWERDNLPPALLSQEEKKLFQRLEINPGDKKVKDEIVERNTGLVRTMARSIKNLYSFSGLELKDLCQTGVIGVMKAMDKFDLKRGNKFSTYATEWIYQVITRAIENQARIIRVPLCKIRMIVKYKKTEMKLFQKLKHFPSTQEIAKEMEIDVSKVRFIEEIKEGTSSLEEPLRKDNGDDGDDALIDFIKDEKMGCPSLKAEEEILKEEVKESLSCLDPRERKILIILFGLEDRKYHTLQEVATVLGITKQRVQQIKKRALEKLRTNPRTIELLK